jgi:hypothetical protein
MTQPIHLIGDTYTVEVPEGATDIGFRFDCLTCIMPDRPGRYKWLTDIEQWMEKQGGEWEVIGTVKECTEEQAHQIVESVTTPDERPVYRDYEFSTWMKTAVGSLRALLTSKGLDSNKNYVLLKKLP